MQTLDAFGYWPAHRSRIKGLGGTEKNPDAAYVFHSPYADLPPGPQIAEVSFDRLKATSGMIAVCVFQLQPDATPQVTERGKTTALLPLVAHGGRPIRVAFEAIEGATYAVIGHVYGDCDARARGINLTVGGAISADEDPAKRRSIFGKWRARRVTGLASVEGPRFAWPVSQGYSEAQLREPEFATWGDRLPALPSDVKRWEAAYILQVLSTYGRLEPEARMLGLSMKPDPVADLAAAQGAEVTPIVLAAGESIEDAVARALPDPAASRGFDAVWSRSDVFGVGGSARAMGLVEELLDRLRPGGLGIHLVTRGAGELDDNALARVAVGLAASGHIVAQLRHDRGPNAPAGPIPFGIVVRKSTDSLLV